MFCAPPDQKKYTENLRYEMIQENCDANTHEVIGKLPERVLLYCNILPHEKRNPDSTARNVQIYITVKASNHWKF